MIRPTCVMGMGRSGTSMISESLAQCGVYFGEQDELTPPSIRNRRGYWENKEAVAINKEIWSLLGGGTMRQPPNKLYEGWQYEPRFGNLADRAGDLIQRLSTRAFSLTGEGRAFGFKDPRFSITWPFWALAAPDLQFVVCVRNPDEVRKSLNWKGKRAGLPVLKLWQYFYQAIDPLFSAHTDPIHSTLGPAVVTHYANWLRDPEREHMRVAGALGLPLEHATGDAVQVNLRHEKSSALLPVAIRRQYAQLCAMAKYSPAPPGAINRAEYSRRYLTAWRKAFYRHIAGEVTKRLHDGAKIFEAGCGTGHLAKQVEFAFSRRKWTIGEYTGFDLSENNIAWASDQNIAGAVFQVGDLYHDLPSGGYDCAICLQTLEHLYNPTGALSSIASLVDYNGLLVVSVPNGKRLDSPTHLHHWNLRGFEQLLKLFGDIESIGPVANNRILLGIVRVK